MPPEVNQQIPAYARNEEGWYEEDIAWATVVYFVPNVEPDAYEEAVSTMKHWFPGIYERVTGTVLQPGKSHCKDSERFQSEHEDDYIVISAWSSWHERVSQNRVGVLATRGGKGKGYNQARDERWFLIPAAEYKIPFGVDLGRYQETKPLE